MRKVLLAATGLVIFAVGQAQAETCWNPPDAIYPGFVPCDGPTGLAAPRRTNGTYGVHPDEWFYNRPISPPGTSTGSSGWGIPSWDQ